MYEVVRSRGQSPTRTTIEPRCSWVSLPLFRISFPVVALVLLCAGPTSAAKPEAGIEKRRSEYLGWITKQFGLLEPKMQPLDGRAWSLNQARLYLNQETKKASRYFEKVTLTADADFMGIRLLKTYLDFERSNQLSEKAKRNLITILRNWDMDRRNGISRWASWPPKFTENHDLMHLTIGMFSEKLRGRSIEQIENELRKSLSWRFERGFYEWGSHRYQLHYSNPLLVLADYAPDPTIRQGAKDLFDLILAERVVMSVRGYLGGPGMRFYGRHSGCDYLDNNRYDSFLPTVWLALGVGEPRFDFTKSAGLQPAGAGYGNGRDPRLNQDEAMFLATSRHLPRSILGELLDEVEKCSEWIYTGRRASAGHPFQNALPDNPRSHQILYYYNTPHVSMGSLQYLPTAGKMSVSYNSRPRFFSVMFGDNPSQVLRTRLTDADLKAKRDQYSYIADRVVQHRNWLLAAGKLSTSHGLESEQVGPWNVYRVGRGLCAHIALSDTWHVFQVSDLDKFRDETAFVAALTLPTLRDGRVWGRTTSGKRIEVDLKTMSIRVDGVERQPPLKVLHDSPWLRSEYWTGRLSIRTKSRQVTLDNTKLKPEPIGLPSLPRGHFRWGNPDTAGATTSLAHVRAMAGISPNKESVLKAVSILLPHNNATTARLAVYVGGSLEKGPHFGSPAQLLFDFGETPKGKAGWVQLTHPTGVLVPADTPIWLMWKGSDRQATVSYVEEHKANNDFQRVRGRWDSKALDSDPKKPWPRTWPSEDKGAFESARYSCFLTLRRAK